MQELFAQLGINWKLLLGQGFNFLLVLALLTLFVYRPLMRVLNERRAKIEQGVRDANAAAERLHDIEVEKNRVLSDASTEGAQIVSRAEHDAKTRRQELVASAEEEAKRIKEHAHETAKRQSRAELEQLEAHAEKLIQDALMKAAHVRPEQLDRAFIDEAKRVLTQGKETV